MKWFNNLMIRQKLIFGFGIVIIFSIILTLFSISTANKIDEQYSYLLKFPKEKVLILDTVKENIVTLRRLVLISVLESGNPTIIEGYKSEAEQLYKELLEHIDDYMVVNNGDVLRGEAVIAANNTKAVELKKALSEYKTHIFDEALALALKNNLVGGKRIIAEGADIINNLTISINSLADTAKDFLNELSDDATVQKNNAIMLFIILAVSIVLISMLIALFTSQALARPVRQLLDMAINLSKGNFNINKTETSKDEVGQLMAALYQSIDVILSLSTEIDGIGKKFNEGEIDAKIDSSKFTGSYKSVVESINSMLSNLIGEVLSFMDCLSKFGNGNFNADIPKMPGKKSIMNENINTLRDNLKSVSGDITSLIREASAGNLSKRVDVNKYSGDWVDLLDNLNRLMETIIAPINEATQVLHKVSLGNFEHKVEGNYKGDFMLIKNSINDTVTNVASYINEISTILGDMADNDNLTQEITRDYVGKFSDIKNAINNIISKFNNIISDILSAADQVASGARQISESSMTLAQGATRQASSIEELNATIATINEGTLRNAENARNAETLAGASQKNAQSGNENMDSMLSSMENINNASNNIAKIIKTIDDIAFQTNLLALNAAVEAARAGEHGAGFAVVADEVRNLAAKSQTAAKETAALIEESIQRVKDGTRIADTTAQALHVIVDDASQVSSIITNISEDSNRQAEAINQVTIGLSQITDVVQSNSATSEEAASASQELSSQADVMKNLVNVFKLKRR